MILPIHVFGESVLREDSVPVEAITDDVRRLAADMIDTMRGADGVGLAAPQVGRRERMCVVDLTPMAERSGDLDAYPPQPMVFVNPAITWESDDESGFEEGCLSIPDIRDTVFRPERVRLTWRDLDGADHDAEFGGLLSRVVQHEVDHLEGILFVDHLSAFKRKMLGRRLRAMSKGEVSADYPLHTSAAGV